MTIYQLRHGETQWNREGRLQGRCDSPLTVKGIEQAFAYAAVLRNEELSLTDLQLQTSPLNRARQTAAIISEILGLSPEQCIESSLLVEHDFGHWEGLTRKDIEASYPGAQRDRHKNHWSYVVPGGESYARIYNRAVQWLQLTRTASITIVVTHAKMSRVLRGAYLGLEPREILRFKHPHNVIYKLLSRRIDELQCSGTT